MSTLARNAILTRDTLREPPTGASVADDAYQDEVLVGVSRTFALTIPELPRGLRRAVTNAYLLCRIADTIEDEAALAVADKERFHQRFAAVVQGRGEAESFASQLYPLLTESTSLEERELVRNCARILAVTATLAEARREAVRHCVVTMCEGMPWFERNASRTGLAELKTLDCYCYYVAGVVGQMLAELFCDYSPRIRARRPELIKLAVSFGQGLQMTNILKDIWEDYERGVCWLPADVFAKAGFDLAELPRASGDPGFADGLTQLIGLANGHLRNAMEFTMMIPGEEIGIRRFCLWAIGLALLTLRKIQKNPNFSDASQVKVSRRAVQATVLTTNLTVADDNKLMHLFRFTARPLPVLIPTLPELPEAIGPPEVYKTTGGTMTAQLHLARVSRTNAEIEPTRLQHAIDRARDAIEADQHPEGYWCYELEADCTIPSEYILMMHFMDEPDDGLESKLANYVRTRQEDHGGWSLYAGGDFDMSCTVKAYYALKLAGDDPESPHMIRARNAVLARGGAVKANVFTHIALAQFGQIPWRGVPFMPVAIMLLPRWFPFHLSKVSYWSRTVMVPLFLLYTLKAQAKNPRGVNVRELFTTAPEEEHDFMPSRSIANRIFKGLDWLGHTVEPFIPLRLRDRAMKKAEQWIVARLNGNSGLGAIFPAMVNAYEALALLGYEEDHPARRQTRKAIDDLLVVRDGEAYCQPCVSPVWDTGLSCLALQAVAGGESSESVRKGLEWLKDRQILNAPGDWRDSHPQLPGGGWAFQFKNDDYPDLDDTAVIAWAMHNANDDQRYGHAIGRAADWLRGMQSKNGGMAAFDSDNNHEYLNEIPFADHGALLDPPTSDVTARVITLLGRLRRAGDESTIRRCIEYLRVEQEEDGSWFGRWGTNYIYGTWAVLVGLRAAGEDMQQPYIRRAVTWLEGMQRPEGGWGESNAGYWDRTRAWNGSSTSFQTAWALLGLLAAGEENSKAVDRGVEYLLDSQNGDGLWREPDYTCPGFPRFFYLKYHGYSKFFPLWALARYRDRKTVSE